MTAIPEMLADMPTPIEPIPGMGNETRTFFAEELRRRGHVAGPIDPVVVADILARNEDRRFDMFEKRRRDRLVSRVKIWLPVAAGVLGALGYGGAVVVAEDPNEVKASDVQTTIEEEAAHERADNAAAASVNAENIGTLAEIAVSQQELTVEAMDHVVEVVKAGPRGADDVKKPAALQAAEDEVEARRRKSKAGSLLKKLPAPQ